MPEINENSENTSEQLNLFDNAIVKSAIRYRWLIFVVFFVSLLVSIYSATGAMDVYSATATLKIDYEMSAATENIGLWGNMFPGYNYNVNPISDKIALLSSRTVAERVVRKLNKNFVYYTTGFKNPGGVSIEIFWLFDVVQPESLSIKITPDGGMVVKCTDVVSGAETESDFSLGDTVKTDKAAFRIDASEGDTGTVHVHLIPVNLMANVMRGLVFISNVEETNMLMITVRHPDPVEARKLANSFAEAMVEYDIQSGRQVAKNVREFIESQLLITSSSLENAERKLKNLQEKYGWLTAQTEKTRVEQQLSELIKMRVNTMVEVRVLEEKISTLKRQLEGEGAISLYGQSQTIPELSLNPTLRSIQEQINNYEIQKSELLGKYTENHPSVRHLDSVIEYLKRQIASETQSMMETYGAGPVDPVWSSVIQDYVITEVELASYRAKFEALNRTILTIQSELDSLPSEIAEFERVYRMVEVEKQTYTLLLQKLQEAKISEATQAGKISLVDSAMTPMRPISSKRKKNVIIAGFIGIVIGFSLAFVLDKLDTTLRYPDEIETSLKIKLLGMIPTISEPKSTDSHNVLSTEKSIQNSLVVHVSPKSPVSEAYRTIRTNLMFSSIDKKLRSITVASALPKEGKSTTAANIAVTFAQQGIKTVLVDTDMRRPVLHNVFSADRTPGLVDYLFELTKIEEVLKPTEVENLSLIPCGTIPPNPSEVIASEKMNFLIEKGLENFDFIVFDSPPILAVTDAVILSKKTEGTVLVVRAEKTDREAAKAAIKSLRNIEAEIKGAVFNSVDMTGKYGYGYYYRYYYQYQYGHDGEGVDSAKKNLMQKIKKFFF
ncbi:polysaccharide biosynthesis tyrosine autokinase [candidate division WOR-3 bacterium]|nr:polysaccharide biosynthesis tyrosine autokinase [candidate division WOR-3 bacterium]